MDKHIFTVSNMNCNGCAATIREGLEADNRVQAIDIELAKKRVSVEGDLTMEEAAAIINSSGFQPEVFIQKKGFLGSLFSN
ncbi:heavy-metal-associated domain-containing protein [bacterium]|nr:heavy-metal-associated domain-containing protein [bacterium]